MDATMVSNKASAEDIAEVANFENIKVEIKEEDLMEYQDHLNSSNQPEQPAAPICLSDPELKPEFTDENIYKPFIKEEDDGVEEPLVEPELFSLASFEDFNQPGPSTCYKCTNCNFTTDKVIVYEIHLRDCALEKRFNSMMASMLIGIMQRCYFCQFESDNLDIMMAHHDEHSQLGQIANFQCDKCAYSSENRFRLVSHTLTHNKFKCEQCPYFHTYEKCVIKHSKNHSFSVKLIAACTSCSFEATDPGSWEGHLTAHRLSGQAVEISCAGCPYKSDAPFNQRSVEVHHKITKHRGFLAQITTFRCTQCAYASYFKWDFVQHTKTDHPDSTPTSLKVLSCSKCAFVADTKLELKDHFDMQHAKIVYNCDGCQFQTRLKERYQLHMINVTLTQRHDRHHHKIIELVQYKCQLCNFTASSDHDLNTHKLLHKTQELMVTVTSNTSEVEGSTSDITLNKVNSKVSNKNEINPKTDKNEVIVKDETSNSRVILKTDSTDECVVDKISLETVKKHKIEEMSDSESSTPKKLKTSPYKCFYCEFEADKKIEVDRHEKTTHRTFDGFFTCPYCAYETTKRCDLRRHYTRKHKNSFKCGNCSYETSSKSEYIQHCASHKRDGLKLHQCSICEYTNDRKSMIQRHELTHRDTSLFCDLCDYKTRRKDDLARHKSKRHQVNTDGLLEVNIIDETESVNISRSCQTTYKCLSCSFKTTLNKDFDCHIDFHKLSNHTVFFKCTDCDGNFPDLDAFKAHQNDLTHSLNLITMDIFTYTCTSCTFKCICQNEFDDHTKWHESSGKMTYKCLGYNFVSTIEKEFEKHVQNHTINKETKYFTCDYLSCGLKFRDWYDFKIHQTENMHDLNWVTIDVLCFSCSVCLYRTWRKDELDLHIEATFTYD